MRHGGHRRSGADGLTSLREAICASNNTAAGAPHTINFNIGGGGIQTIVLASALPVITRPLTIDGSTQPGYAGAPLIVLDGAYDATNGLEISAGGSTVRGLVIHYFTGCGIYIHTNGGNTIQGSYIGTDASGIVGLGNHSAGIYIENALNNTIGGTNPGEGNLLSANSAGITIYGSSATGNQVLGNKIGTDISGTADLGNSSGSGIFIWDAPGNTIGGADPGAGNLISGNGFSGITLTGNTTTGNLVLGNNIGTDVSGTTSLGTSNMGILIDDAPGNTIGGAAPGEGNLISGNSVTGIILWGRMTTGNLVLGNKIGTDISGTLPIANDFGGIEINFYASNNIIGGTAPGEGNLVSGNIGAGIGIANGATGNQVLGNKIGTDISGTSDLGNYYGPGIYIGGAPNNIIGGAEPGAGNLISGNYGAGVYISGWDGTEGENKVLGNKIGTDISGTISLGNHESGIFIGHYSYNNIIGGAASGEGNLISGNFGHGIKISSGAIGNQVLGNSIYDNGALGIELGRDGVTANDPLDTDTGPNNLQNYPELTWASTSPGGTIIRGWLRSTPNTSFTLHFYASPACDASGYGEGQIYLGEHSLATDGSGEAQFRASLTTSAPAGYVVTATATAPDGSTSEFSACAPLQENVIDLSLTKTAAPASLMMGYTLVHTLTATNLGAAPATEVTLQDNLPAGLIFTSASPGCTHTAGTVACTLASLDPAASNTWLISATVDIPTGFLVNSATVNANESDAYLADNSAQASVWVASSQVVYDLMDHPGPEWSDPILTTSPCGTIFLGEFGNQQVSLSLQDLPAHTQVMVNYDLYILRSWNGNASSLPPLPLTIDESTYPPGPDIWRMFFQGAKVIQTTFSNWLDDWFPQAFPGFWPISSFPAQTGAAAVNTLCFEYHNLPMDAAYHFSQVFDHTGEDLKLDFSASGLQALENESWGLDNVQALISSGGAFTPFRVFLPFTLK